MPKRTTFTSISPLPPGISRQAAIRFLQDKEEMIDLNPLVKDRHQIPPPPHAPEDELGCIWYSVTDAISYLPGGLATGDITYSCAFNELSNGIQTHCYAPAGVNIRSTWTVNGTLPGEPPEPVELGIGAPSVGLYIREDVDLRCNVLMAGFTKKTIKKSHGVLMERLLASAGASGPADPAQHKYGDDGSSISSWVAASESEASSRGRPRDSYSHVLAVANGSSLAPPASAYRAGSAPPPSTTATVQMVDGYPTPPYGATPSHSPHRQSGSGQRQYPYQQQHQQHQQQQQHLHNSRLPSPAPSAASHRYSEIPPAVPPKYEPVSTMHPAPLRLKQAPQAAGYVPSASAGHPPIRQHGFQARDSWFGPSPDLSLSKGAAGPGGALDAFHLPGAVQDPRQSYHHQRSASEKYAGHAAPVAAELDGAAPGIARVEMAG